jgi:pimeloyl-ACP methyl ester carboxylesterase
MATALGSVYAIAILVGALIAVLYLAVSLYFARVIVHPHRQPIALTPGDYGLEYDDVIFSARDGLTVRGWLIPGSGKGLVIQTHPNPFNRIGFNPKKQGFPPLYRTPVDLLANARVLHEAGYSVLAFDFRNAGTSDSGITAIGLTEWQDVAGALDWAASDPRTRGLPVAFASFCLGADSTIVAASRDKAAFSRVTCVFAVQPISAKIFIESFLAREYSPLSLALVPAVSLFTRLLGSYPLAEMTPIPSAPDLTCPVLYLQARADPWTRLSDVESIVRDTGSSDKRLVFIEGKMGRFDAYNWVHEHPSLMLAFFAEHLGPKGR